MSFSFSSKNMPYAFLASAFLWTIACTAFIIATGQSDCQMFLPMSTPAAPCVIASCASFSASGSGSFWPPAIKVEQDTLLLLPQNCRNSTSSLYVHQVPQQLCMQVQGNVHRVPYPCRLQSRQGQVSHTFRLRLPSLLDWQAFAVHTYCLQILIGQGMTH